MRTLSTTVLAVSLALGLSGCENFTSPGGKGEARVQALAIGDDSSGSASPSASAAPYALYGGQAEGTVRFDARVFVRTAASQWLEVTPSAAQSATVDASGRADAVVLASTELGVASYNRVRVVFSDVEADVQGGITIGTGILTGRVTVDLGAKGETVVEREIQVEARAGTTTNLVVDLNADAWLSRTHAQARTVSEADFQSAVRIVSR